MNDYTMCIQALEWVSEAGKMVENSLKSKLGIQTKGHHSDLVTDIDLAVELFLTERIQSSYPHHSIVSEESYAQASAMSEYIWILDPIDGTTNLINRKQDFAISLALCKDGRGLFGIVYAVMNQQLFHCFRGMGAYLNDKRMDALSPNSSLKDELLALITSWFQSSSSSDFPYKRLITAARGLRIYGASTIELCNIASGKLGIYVHDHIQPWDYAASRVILEELGCQFSDLQGNEISWLYQGGIIAATPTVLHEAVCCLNPK